MLEVFNLNERESWQRYTTTSLESYIRFRRWDNTWAPWLKYKMGDDTQDKPNKPVEPPAPTSVKKDIAFPWQFVGSAIRIGNTVTINVVRKIKAVTSQYENELMPETIPEGFRPAVDAALLLNANERANIIGSAIFHLSSAGEIRMTTYLTNTAVWTGTITYLTEDPMPK